MPKTVKKYILFLVTLVGSLISSAVLVASYVMYQLLSSFYSLIWKIGYLFS